MASQQSRVAPPAAVVLCHCVSYTAVRGAASRYARDAKVATLAVRRTQAIMSKLTIQSPSLRRLAISRQRSEEYHISVGESPVGTKVYHEMHNRADCGL